MRMSKREEIYRRFRVSGFSAAEALRGAKILERWAEAGQLVSLSAGPEYEDYFSVYGEPEGYTDLDGRHHSAEEERKEICEQIERDGCHTVLSHWRTSEDDSWQVADSVGRCIYHNPLSPYENVYVLDLMSEAIRALENAIDRDLSQFP